MDQTFWIWLVVEVVIGCLFAVFDVP